MIGETLQLQPVTGRVEHTVSIEKKTEIPLGTERFKYYLTAALKGRQMKLVTRDQTPNFISAWQMLHQNGFPTYRFVRIAQNENRSTVVLPDMTADGSKLYGKSLADELRRNPRYIFRPSAIDRQMIHVVIKYYQEISKEAYRLAEKATKLGLVLTDDAEPFELKVDSSGNWQLFMMDIEQVRRRIDGLESENDVANANNESVRDFLRNITAIKNALVRRAN